MLIEFFLPSLLMGLGIAIDVALVTIIMSGNSTLGRKSWVLPVTLTHTLFPAVGYCLFWFLGKNHHYLSNVLGWVGATLVFAYVYELLCEWHERDALFSLSQQLEKLSKRFKLPLPVYWLPILSVSWDALLCGPAKSAQATLAAWAPWQVALSLLMIGLIVWGLAELSLLFARKVLRQPLPPYWAATLKYAQISVIAGFGLLSLKLALPDTWLPTGLYGCIVLASLVAAPLMISGKAKHNSAVTAR